MIDEGELIAVGGVNGRAVVEFDDSDAFARACPASRGDAADALARQFTNLSSGGQGLSGKQTAPVNCAWADDKLRLA